MNYTDIKVSHRSAKRSASHKKRPNAKSKTVVSPSKTEQDEIDHILDKISNSGYESLTKEEKQKLFNASNQ